MRFASSLRALVVGALLGFLPLTTAHADTVTVQNGNDSGPGSLREAINSCNALGGTTNSSIRFAASVTDIALQSSLPTITGRIFLGNPGSDNSSKVTIHPAAGAGAFRLLHTGVGSSCSLNEVHLSGGSADQGGLILAEGFVSFDQSILEGGVANQGGAGYCTTSGQLYFDQTTLKGNTAVEGGAIYNGGTSQASSCTFSGNSATRGGAVATYLPADNSSHLFSLNNSTMSDNTASEAGGGIYSYKSIVHLGDSTIAGNTAPAGAGLAVVAPSSSPARSEVAIGTTILAGNLTPGGDSSPPNDFSEADPAFFTLNSQGSNLVGSTSGSLSFSSTDRTGVTPEQLNLGALADNLGPTQTRALLPGSIAIDAGQTSIAADQRGAGRTAGAAPDIGAYEAPSQGNNAPLANSGFINAVENQPISYQLPAQDLDGDHLTYNAVGTLPSSISIDRNTGIVSGVFTQPTGYSVFQFQVSDGHNTSKAATINYSVFAASNLIVNTTGPSTSSDNLTSLQEAIYYAGFLTTPGTITFQLPVGDRVITLNDALPPLPGVSIIGPTVGGGVTIQRQTGANAAKFNLFQITGSKVALSYLTFKDGDADTGNGSGNGGAISITGGQAIINSCTFTGNHAIQGGAIYVDAAAPTQFGLTLTASNCTFTGNSVSAASTGGDVATGGAIAVALGRIEIESCTITGNTAPAGSAGAIAAASDGTVTVRVSNSIVAGNLTGNLNSSGGGSSGFDVAPFGSPQTTNPFFSSGHNLVGISQTPNAFTAQSDNYGVAADLHLSPLTDNGGPTQTIALQFNSPALDKGAASTNYDQRGFSRPFGIAADIGAYEAHPSAAPIISQISIVPSAPLIGDTLTAKVTASDPDGTPLTLTYQWSRVRAGVSKVFSTSGATFIPDTNNFQPGDQVRLDVTASDEFTTVGGNSSVTLGNHPIVITQFTWQPKAPYSNEVMTATVKTQDADKTLPSFTYTWKCNGVVTRTFKSRSSQDEYDLGPKGRGDKGDVIEVSVVATDGIASATASGSATVRNSAPVVSLLSLAPAAPLPTGTVVATYGGRDVDGDTLQRTYLWRVGTKILKDEKGARVDLSKYPFVKAGDVVSVDLQLFDGLEYSKTLTAKVTVGAAPMVIVPSPSSS